MEILKQNLIGSHRTVGETLYSELGGRACPTLPYQKGAVMIPNCNTPLEPHASRPGSSEEAPAGAQFSRQAPVNNQFRFLVVDDDLDSRNGVSAMLEAKGYSVETASSGEAALTALRRSQTEVVLLRRDLPGMDGLEVCRQIKSDLLLRRAFVVLISGSSIPGEDDGEGLEAGADGCLSRSISNRELAAWIDAYVRIVRLTADSREIAGRLDEQNQVLHHQQIASLSLMNDAMAARDQAEELNQALRYSEERFRSLVEAASDAIFVLVEDRFSYVNAAACRLLGAGGPEQLLGQSVLDRYDPSARDCVRDRMARVLAGNGPVPVVEETWLRLDGREISVEVSAVSLTHQGRKAILVFGRGITERRLRDQRQALAMQVLATLNRGNDVSRLIGDILQLIKTGLDVEAVAIRLREGDAFPYCEVSGFPPDFIESKLHLCSCDPDAENRRGQDGGTIPVCMCGVVVSGIVDSSKSYFTGRGSYWTNSSTELCNLAPGADGSVPSWNRCSRDGDESIALIPLRAGADIIGLIQLCDHRKGLFTRETIEFLEGLSASIGIAVARRRAVEALRLSEARVRALFEASPDALFVVGPDGLYTEVNPVAVSRTGFSREELLATGPAGLAAPDLTSQVPGYLLQAQKGTVVFEWRQRHKNGVEIPVEVVASPLVFDGKPCVFSVVRDMTERKRAEHEHQELQKQFLQVQKMDAIGRLAGGIAHDFNNLLMVINGRCDLLLKQLHAIDPMRESITEITDAGHRAAALTRQLLAFSRKQVTQPRVLDLNSEVQKATNMLRRLMGEDIDLITELDPHVGMVMVDPGQIGQVLMNLAVNARDAMPTGGTFVIETANVYLDSSYAGGHVEVKPGPYVRLTVSDSGIGMNEEVRSHLFEPFFTTKKPGEGTGLGLATVFGAVKQAGGAIWVYTEPGDGTTFKIHLPRIDAAATYEEATPAGENLRGSETVLLVEDQPDLRNLLRAVLQDWGYHVIDAANGLDALLAAERFHGAIHLLLTDVVMPLMSGRDVADQLSKIRPNIKTLYMSGHAEHMLTNRGILNAGGAYLQKPASPEDVAAKVRQVLDSSSAAGKILVVDDDESVRRVLIEILKAGGYETLESGDGKHAVEMLRTSEVDLVITDLVMPEQEGIETIATIRKHWPNVRIMAMSGALYGNCYLRVAEKLGADVVLNKPIEAGRLLASVQQVLRKQTQ